MARIEVHEDRVVIRLTTSEQLLALRREAIVLERAAITSAIITDNPYVWIRGVRAPGARVPGKLAIGTWRGSAGRDFVVVRSGRDAVVLDFDVDSQTRDSEHSDGFDVYSRVVISTTHAAELVRVLRIDDGDSVVYSD